jgi:hypothetical protein
LFLKTFNMMTERREHEEYNIVKNNLCIFAMVVFYFC